MKLFQKIKKSNGRQHIYFCGVKILSLKNTTKYDKIYAKRFKGLTEEEMRYCLTEQFQRNLGYTPNLDNPQTFNEKLQWLKLYYHNPLMTKCADKVAVREYIKEKIGEEYLVPCLGIWDNPDDINFDQLPNQFVLKVNWGSGQNIIVKDKAKLDINEAREKLRHWMKPESNHYYNFFEWGYKDIQPKIIAEKYITQNGKPVQDYKWFCFNGVPEVVSITMDSYDYSKMTINYYDKNLKFLPYKNPYPNIPCEICPPKYFYEMKKICEKISKDFPFIRVDLYDTGNDLYVGELTFYPGAGFDPFDPPEWDKKFGDMLVLPKKKK